MIIESLHHCQIKKGLVIHAWCLMSNHLHLIISRKSKLQLEEILRDFKKFTSGTILKAIQNNHPEELITNEFIDQKRDYIH